MEKLKVLFGFSVEEDPLKREIEEIRRLAKEAVKSAEKAEKRVGKVKAVKGDCSGGGGSKEGKGGRGIGGFFRIMGKGSRNEESGGLSKAAEEMESIFAEVLEQL